MGKPLPILMLLSVLLFSVSEVWSADYREGVSAYKSGDYETALEHFRELADDGHTNAQVFLGFMYRRGHGVTRDYEEAVKWYRLAADQGYTGAQNNIGFLYAKGLGVSRDYKEARKWFKLAADQGHSGGKPTWEIFT